MFLSLVHHASALSLELGNRDVMNRWHLEIDLEFCLAGAKFCSKLKGEVIRAETAYELISVKIICLKGELYRKREIIFIQE